MEEEKIVEESKDEEVLMNIEKNDEKVIDIESKIEEIHKSIKSNDEESILDGLFSILTFLNEPNEKKFLNNLSLILKEIQFPEIFICLNTNTEKQIELTYFVLKKIFSNKSITKKVFQDENVS
jgi:hypothetical protein